MATASLSTAMNPTTTEHDFRFPRRPDQFHGRLSHDNHQAAASTAAAAARGAATSAMLSHKAGAGDLRTSLEELNLDFSTTHSAATTELLKSAVFPAMRDATAGMVKSPEELQREDPLATQVWKFFNRTKLRLPNQQRMENLTWRMMHQNLRKKQLDDDKR